MQDFKHIIAWQRGLAFSVTIHKLAKPFARAGFGNLRSQLTRAADAIPANVAEGAAAATTIAFARFLDIAIKSSNETEHHLICAQHHGLITHAVWSPLNAEVVEIRKMTYTYRRKLLATTTK